jgi:hypothetical protein
VRKNRRVRDNAVGRRWRLAVTAALAMGAGCDNPAQPTQPPIALTVPAVVTGRYVACEPCEVALWVSLEFPVTVGDPEGSGGTVQEVRVTATNRSRGQVLAGGSRPNADFSYPDTTIAAGGRLTLMAGLVISPAPPPRDEVVIGVLVTLGDGRFAVGSARLAVSAD